jgi:hypothetical protein
MRATTDADMLLIAAGVSLRKSDGRAFRLGAVGRRNDGALVASSNGPSPFPAPDAHAEARLTHKLNPGSTVWVSRVRRDGTLGMARPCPSCERRLRAAGVSRVVYTISDTEHGVINLLNGDEVQRPLRTTKGGHRRRSEALRPQPHNGP